MESNHDRRIVMTLDAGGTNFVFSAYSGGKVITESVKLPANADDLDKSLSNIIEGFTKIANQLPKNPDAISFAFPGPTDYPNGIVINPVNLRGYYHVALKNMLEEKFQIPVFINNDGNLFAYGEAIAGFLPWVNDQLEKHGSIKRYVNLFGITLGTGFGAGICLNGELLIGDNSNAGEIYLMRNYPYTDYFIEESASIRGVIRTYKEHCKGECPADISPEDLYHIARGNKDGDQEAARKAFEELGEVVGEALANAITLVDGLVVIGGGLAGAAELFLPKVVDHMNGEIYAFDGSKIPRLATRSYNLEDPQSLENFLQGDEKTIQVPFSDKTIQFDPEKRIGIGVSRLTTSEAIALGAYYYALKHL
jgi:glucokinase